MTSLVKLNLNYHTSDTEKKMEKKSQINSNSNENNVDPNNSL